MPGGLWSCVLKSVSICVIRGLNSGSVRLDPPITQIAQMTDPTVRSRRRRSPRKVSSKGSSKWRATVLVVRDFPRLPRCVPIVDSARHWQRVARAIPATRDRGPPSEVDLRSWRASLRRGRDCASARCQRHLPSRHVDDRSRQPTTHTLGKNPTARGPRTGPTPTIVFAPYGGAKTPVLALSFGGV